MTPPVTLRRGRLGDIAECRDFLLSVAHILTRHPSLLFQEAANRAPGELPAIAARARWHIRPEQGAWLRLVHAADARTTCRLTITGHDGQVHTCGFSPNGKKIASVSGDGTVRIWDVDTGREVLSLEADGDTDWPPLFLSSNQILVQGPDHSLRIHDIETGTFRLELAGNGDAVTALAISPDENLLVWCSSAGDVHLWDLRENRLRARRSEHTNWIRACVFSADGRRFATNSWDMTTRLWGAERGDVLAVLDGSSADAVQTLAFTSDSRRLVVASGLAIQTIDASTGVVLAGTTVRETGGTNIVFVLTNDGDRIILACAGVVRVYDSLSLDAGPILGGDDPSEEIRCLAISPDGRIIASAGDGDAIRLWDLKTSREIGKLTGHTEVVRGLDFAPAGRLLASASWDHTVRLWDVEAASEEAGERAEDCRFTPRGRLAVFARRKKLLGIDRKGYGFTEEHSSLHIHDASTGFEVAAVDESRTGDATGKWQVSPDAAAVLFRDGDTGTLIIDLETGRQVATLGRHDIECFATWPDASRFVTIGMERRDSFSYARLRIHEPSGSMVDAWWLPRDHRPDWCCVAAGGAAIATADLVTRRFRVWRTADATPMIEIDIEKSEPPCIVSRNGMRLILRSAPGTLELVNAIDGRRAGTLAHETEVLHWVVTTSGDYVVTAAIDGMVRVWDVESGQAIAGYPQAARLERGVRLSSDGARLLLLPESEWTRSEKHISQRTEVQVMDVRRSRLLARFFVPGDIREARWSPESTRIAAITYGGAVVLLGLEGAAKSVPLWAEP